MRATTEKLSTPAYQIRIQPDVENQPSWYVGAATATIKKKVATIRGLVVLEEFAGRMLHVNLAIRKALIELGVEEVEFWRWIDGRNTYHRNRITRGIK